MTASSVFFSRYWRYAGISLALVLVSSLSYFRVFDLYELQTYDWRCRLRGERPVSKDIVLIDIWDDTLEALGAWPIERSYHADLIRVLGAYGVKAVGFDTLFVEPRAGDEAVAQAAKAADNVYFVYAFYNPQPVAGRFISEKMLAPLIPSYVEAAKGAGHVNARADIDGKRRRTYPVIYQGDKPYFQLSLRMAMDVLGVAEKEVSVDGRRLRFGDKLDLPLDDGYLIINFAGKWEKTFTHYSYYDILAAQVEKMQGQTPRIDLNTLKGKYCFIGLTSLGSHDANAIPIQSIYPMVGLYANVLNSILEKDFIRRADRPLNLLVLLFWSAVIVWMSAKLKPMKALGVALLLLLLFAAAVLFIFILWGFWLDLFYPFMVFILLYAAATLGRSLFEVRKRELVENELKIASQIQKSFLPATLPEQKGLSLAVHMRPAKAVGGDLYAFIPLEGDRLGVMVGDVSGKGTPAALFMAKAVSEFKFSARDKTDPAQALTAMNESISSETTGGLFVTLSYGIFDLRNQKLLLSNGGHLPVVLANSEDRTELLSGEEGMPIGVMPGVLFANLEKKIRPGDCFAFYSDGVSEARDRKKQEFGIEALEAVLRESRSRTAQDILDYSIRRLDQFMGKAEQHDDITLIIVKVV